MSEIVRFRVARSPQRRSVDFDQYIELYPEGKLSEFAMNVLNVGAISRSNIPAGYLHLQGLNGQSTTLSSPLDDLDQWLLSLDNSPPPSELAKKIRAAQPENPVIGHMMSDNSAPNVREQLADLLLATLLTQATPQLRSRLTRLLTLVGLIELFLKAPSKLSTRKEIYRALRWRTILLPREVYEFFEFPEFKRSRAIREGFSDLYLAREEWVRYQAGEISHIENVRAQELKERSLKRLTEREDTFTTEAETLNLTERSTESTDRFELSDEVARDARISVGVEGSVETSGQYGPTFVETHLGGTFDYSQNESSSKASNKIKESVERAVSRIEQKTREQRIARTLVRTESQDLHSLMNKTDIDRVSVYRWVNKIKRVQIFRYRNRYLLEFQIPEPGAWWRWLLSQPRSKSPLAPKPISFTLSGNEPTNNTDLLTYDNISIENYQQLGARYLALGLTPPPASRQIGAQINSAAGSTNEEQVVIVVDRSVSVPEGFQASTWEGVVLLGNAPDSNNPGYAVISVGVEPSPSGASFPLSSGRVQGNSGHDIYISGQVGGINTGVVPIVAIGQHIGAFAASISINCEPNAAGLLRWKISTYEKIAAAYAEMQRQYDEEQRNIDDAIPSMADRYPPARNQEIILDEFKKHVISMMTGVDINGRSALEFNSESDDQPMIDITAAERFGPEIQFIEQAFEWGNLSYVLYPYFWAGRDRWPSLAPIDGADPDFARFLRSGSARVVIPARPGFAEAVQLYARTGILWGGGPVPAPNDPDYLSIAEEIKSMQQTPDDGERGESWEVTLPTALICLGDGSSLPINGSLKLNAPPGLVLP